MVFIFDIITMIRAVGRNMYIRNKNTFLSNMICFWKISIKIYRRILKFERISFFKVKINKTKNI